jgi:hypothetical protein
MLCRKNNIYVDMKWQFLGQNNIPKQSNIFKIWQNFCQILSKFNFNVSPFYEKLPFCSFCTYRKGLLEAQGASVSNKIFNLQRCPETLFSQYSSDSPEIIEIKVCKDRQTDNILTTCTCEGGFFSCLNLLPPCWLCL